MVRVVFNRSAAVIGVVSRSSFSRILLAGELIKPSLIFRDFCRTGENSFCDTLRLRGTLMTGCISVCSLKPELIRLFDRGCSDDTPLVDTDTLLISLKSDAASLKWLPYDMFFSVLGFTSGFISREAGNNNGSWFSRARFGLISSSSLPNASEAIRRLD